MVRTKLSGEICQRKHKSGQVCSSNSLSSNLNMKTAERENTQIILATTKGTDQEFTQDSNTTKTTSTVASILKVPTLISNLNLK